MLALTRKVEEEIYIDTPQGDRIKIMVLEIRGDRGSQGMRVRLGFEAPKSVTIHRKEVVDAIQKEKHDKLSKSSKSVLTLRQALSKRGGG